jgi:hypothetical protein
VARDAIVQNWPGVITPDMRQVLANGREAMHQWRATESEFQLRRADGLPCWMLGRASSATAQTQPPAPVAEPAPWTI